VVNYPPPGSFISKNTLVHTEMVPWTVYFDFETRSVNNVGAMEVYSFGMKLVCSANRNWICPTFAPLIVDLSSHFSVVPRGPSATVSGFMAWVHTSQLGGNRGLGGGEKREFKN
jgi:hypothetical protein